MAKVTVSFGAESVGEYPLDEPAVVVGRDASAGIHIDNLGVSRAHCQFIKRGNSYILQDMNSANGTFVNGRRIGEHNLNDGDEILIGKFALRFDAHSNVSKPTAAEPQDGGMMEGLHTYVMDGSRIRERLAEMSAQSATPDSETPPPGLQPGPGEAGRKQPATARVPRPATPPPAMTVPRPGVGVPPRPVAMPGSGVPPQPVAGPDLTPMRAMDHALDFDPLKPQSRPGRVTAHMRRPAAGPGLLLYLSLAINVVLIVLMGVLIFLLVRMMKSQPPPTDRPTAPAPATGAAGEAGPGGP